MLDYELSCNGYKSISFGFQMFNAEAIVLSLQVRQWSEWWSIPLNSGLFH